MHSHSLLVRVSELKSQMNTSAAGLDSKLRGAILSAGTLVERLCDRRFDEYIDTFSYSARQVDQEGDLIGHHLALDHDLKSPSLVLTGEATEVSVTSLPRNFPIKFFLEPVPPHFWIRNPDQSGTDIRVAGVWGYRGDWEYLEGVAAPGADALVTLIPIGDKNLYEVGDLIKIESEYMIVDRVDPNHIHVTRAYNGSTATPHAQAAAIYLFVPDALVRHVVKRLVQWHLAQAESPLTNQVVVGDFNMVTSVDATPDDIRSLIKTLKRRPRMGG